MLRAIRILRRCVPEASPPLPSCWRVTVYRFSSAPTNDKKKFDPKKYLLTSFVNTNYQNYIASDNEKKTPKRKRLFEEEAKPKEGFWNLVAYATAEEYDLQRLKDALIKQDLYIPCELSGDEALKSGVGNAIHAVAKYRVTPENRRLFFFREGSVVMWNCPLVERHAILNFLKCFEEQSYDEPIVKEELEVMHYTYTDNGKTNILQDGCIFISRHNKTEEQISFDRYTLSNGVAMSVKLGILEASLEDYIRRIEFVTEDLKFGRRIRVDQKRALRKSGELFALRHSINLSSNLLDTPDFYWDHEELEHLFQRTCNYFEISRRTKVMNEKLNHCVELMELVSHHLSDRHHVRLEWMIIVLIMVEVGFEVLHFLEH
jgi:uncharacterized Rmd1/YagE family protein